MKKPLLSFRTILASRSPRRCDERRLLCRRNSTQKTALRHLEDEIRLPLRMWKAYRFRTNVGKMCLHMPLSTVLKFYQDHIFNGTLKVIKTIYTRLTWILVCISYNFMCVKQTQARFVASSMILFPSWQRSPVDCSYLACRGQKSPSRPSL